MGSQPQTVTIADDLAELLETFRHEHDVPDSLSALVDAALRQYLRARGYVTDTDNRPLRLTPAEHGSGHTDISVEHDRYLYEAPE